MMETIQSMIVLADVMVKQERKILKHSWKTKKKHTTKTAQVSGDLPL